MSRSVEYIVIEKQEHGKNDCKLCGRPILFTHKLSYMAEDRSMDTGLKTKTDTIPVHTSCYKRQVLGEN